MADAVQEILSDLDREDVREYPLNAIEKALLSEKTLTPHLFRNSGEPFQ